MVLLQKIVESAIVDNLKKRFMDDCIYVRYLIIVCESGLDVNSLYPMLIRRFIIT